MPLSSTIAWEPTTLFANAGGLDVDATPPGSFLATRATFNNSSHLLDIHCHLWLPFVQP